jgi:hypothetical protein
MLLQSRLDTRPPRIQTLLKNANGNQLRNVYGNRPGKSGPCVKLWTPLGMHYCFAVCTDFQQTLYICATRGACAAANNCSAAFAACSTRAA